MIILFLIALGCSAEVIIAVLALLGTVGVCKGLGDELDKWRIFKEERGNRRWEQGLDPDGASYKPLTSKQWEAEFRRK